MPSWGPDLVNKLILFYTAYSNSEFAQYCYDRKYFIPNLNPPSPENK